MLGINEVEYGKHFYDEAPWLQLFRIQPLHCWVFFIFFVCVIYVCFVLCSKVFESKRVGSLAVVLGDLLLGAATFRTQFRQPRFDMDSILEGTNLRSEKVKQGLSRSVNVTFLRCLTCNYFECIEMY